MGAKSVTESKSCTPSIRFPSSNALPKVPEPILSSFYSRALENVYRAVGAGLGGRDIFGTDPIGGPSTPLNSGSMIGVMGDGSRAVGAGLGGGVIFGTDPIGGPSTLLNSGSMMGVMGDGSRFMVEEGGSRALPMTSSTARSVYKIL